MQAMDNAKVIEAIEKYALQKYLEELAKSRLNKISLFCAFPGTTVINLTQPQNFVIVEDLSSFSSLNSGSFNN